jgi:hypothetical protein
MLTGRVPFEGESVGEVLMKHLTAAADLTPLAEPYRTVVARALAKDPDVRFRTVQEFMAKLPAPPNAGSAFARYPQVRPGLGAAPDRGNPPDRAGVRGVPAGGRPPTPRSPLHPDAVSMAVRLGFDFVGNKWKSLGTAARVAIVAAAIFLLLTYSGVMDGRSKQDGGLKLFLTLGTGVLMFIILRWIASWPPYVPSNRPVLPADVRSASVAGEARQPQPVVLTPPQVVEKRSPTLPTLALLSTPRERAAELAGSLLVSAVVSAAMALVMILLRGEPASREQYAWLFLTSSLGAWGVLILSKFWDHSGGEIALRRFGMLLLGLGYGVVAYGLSLALLVQLPFEFYHDRARFQSLASFARNFYDASGNPLPYAYMAYFGFLFLIVRWWLQTNPLRPTRLSVWSTFCAVAVAGLLNLVWPFPQPWGMMVAATISIAVQLSSPWVPPQKRLRRRTA